MNGALRQSGFGTATLRLPNPLALIVWLSVFLPGHLYDWWGDKVFAILILFFSVLMVAVKSSPWETRAPSRQALTFFFLIQFLYAVSYVYSTAFNGIETGPRDAYEMCRFLIVGSFGIYLIRHGDGSVRQAVERALSAMPWFALVTLASFQRSIPVLTPLLKGFLYADTKTSVGQATGQFRLAAPFANPNYLGFVSTLALAYLLFFARGRLRFIHAAATLVVVFCSGSRTAWAATAVVLAFAAAAYAYMGLLRFRLKYALQLSLGLFLLIIAGVRYSARIMDSPRMRRVVNAAQSGGIQEEANAAKRLDQFRYAFTYIERSPVLGWGPSKYETMTYVDNQYLLWLLRLGGLGTVVILAGLGLAGWKLVRSARGDPLARAGTLAYLAALALMLMTGQFLDNFRMMFLAAFVAAAMHQGRT